MSLFLAALTLYANSVREGRSVSSIGYTRIGVGGVERGGEVGNHEVTSCGRYYSLIL